MILSHRLFLPALLLVWSSTATAATTGGQVKVALEQSATASLSKFDCENNGTQQIGFNYTFPFLSNQVVEYFLAPDSGCALPQGSPINTGSSTSVNSVVIQTLNPRPTPSNTTTGLSFSDSTTNLTVAGIWNWYADFKNNASGVTALQYSSGVDTTSCIDDVNNAPAYLCVVLQTQDPNVPGTTIFPAGFVTFTITSLPPDAPTAPTVTTLDSGLKVSWSPVTTPFTATSYVVHVQDPATMMDVKTAEVLNGGVQATINGLTNGTTYNVFVVARDNAGTSPPATANVSDPSPTVEGTPVPSISYFEEYHRNGGTETGGCDSTGSASLLLLAPLLLILRRRRGATLLAGLLLIGSVARAEDTTDTDPANAPIQRQPSPEWVRLEFQIGPFNPNPDQGLPVAVYSKMFPKKNQLLAQLAVHANFFSLFGHAAAGLSIGYWQNSGNALAEDHINLAGDTETLTLVPFTPMLSYRADFLYSKWKFPLIPYGKIGYQFTYFQDAKNGKTTTGTDPVTGAKWHSYGWAMGLYWAAGISLPLDFFDQRRAANLDEQYGINSTGIYGEYSVSYAKGIHGGLPLGGATWSGGVYLSF